MKRWILLSVGVVAGSFALAGSTALSGFRRHARNSNDKLCRGYRPDLQGMVRFLPSAGR